MYDIVRLRLDALGEDAALSGQVAHKSAYQGKGRSLERKSNNDHHDSGGGRIVR